MKISKVFPVLGLAMLLVANPAKADGAWQPIQLDPGSSPQVADRYYQVGLFTDGSNYRMDVHIEAGAVLSDICLMEVDSVPQSGPNAHLPQGNSSCIAQPDGSDVIITLPITQTISGISGTLFVKGTDGTKRYQEIFNAGWSSFAEQPTGITVLVPVNK